MPLILPDCKMTFVCGPIASGKTYLIKRWIENDNRHVIFDSTGEYMEDTSREEVWANPAALHARLKLKPYYYRIVYVPGRDRAQDFEYVLNAVWWRTEAPKLLVCDEVADICPVDSLDANIEMLLRFARKDRLGFLTASQRIADVHKLFTGGCRVVVLFQTNEARDLDAIHSRWKCADMVESLRPLIYDDNTQVTKQIPQCVVIEKGQKPYVYDFKTDAPAKGNDEDDGRLERPTDVSQGTPDAPGASAGRVEDSEPIQRTANEDVH